jgi:hypothetical protein
MVRLEDLTPGVRVSGILPGAVRIIAVHTYGNGAVEATYKDADGEVGQQILYRADESKLGLVTVSGPTFDGDGAAFRLAAEALRIRSRCAATSKRCRSPSAIASQVITSAAR